jgi:DNA-binding GntR family transcriptional regulator
MTTLEQSDSIVRSALHHEAAARLRELIFSGELEPRSRINEVALSERFGISRTPLREAIKLLAAEGLLELVPNRGARVVALSEGEIDEILEVVAALEGAAGELAAAHIADAELTAIESKTLDMIEAWKAGDYPHYYERNREIHNAIMAAARNDVLFNVYNSLSGRVQRARYSAPKTDAQWRRAIDDHNLMVILLRRRDGAALAQLMRDHIKSMKAFISAAYSDTSPPPPSERTRGGAV